jgi:sodium/proline symporter
MNWYFLSAFLLYFFILLIIGLLAHRKHTSSADFIMGNRSLNFWLVALSAHASDMSAWLFMGLPMSVFLLGLSQAWIAVGLIVGMYLNWQFVAPRLRTLTEKYQCYTLSSFFEKRFNDSSGVIRSISAIMLIIFLTHYLSAGMIGIGILLESLFGLNYYFGLSFALCVVVAYTFLGGFVAVAWTDLFQGIFLLFAIILVPYLASQTMGGTQEALLEAQRIQQAFFPSTDISSIITMMLLAVSWGLGYFGMPHVITKFMSIKDVSELKKSKRVGIAWQIIVLSAAVWIGFLAIAFFAQGISNPQMVFVDMVTTLFHPFFAGFILCAVLAASMSTMDSQILVCASVLSEDLYPAIVKNASSDAKLRISRLGVVGVSLLAMLLSFNKSTTIMDTVSYSWAGLGSAFGPLVLSALYAKRVNRYGAIAGIIAGGSMAMAWPHLNPLIMEYSLPSMIPGFCFSFLFIQLISYLTRNQEEVVDLPLANSEN